MAIHVKGSTITSRVRFVRERYGEEGLRRIKEALTPEHRRILDGRVLPHAWVPYSLFIELSERIDATYGGGDLAMCREMGAYGAEVNLPTLYRIFYKLGSLAFILRKAARIWDVHYDSGRMEVETGPGWARLHIVDFAEPHRAHCLGVLGWAEASARISGVTTTRVAEAGCRAKGDAACVLELDWKA